MVAALVDLLQLSIFIIVSWRLLPCVWCSSGGSKIVKPSCYNDGRIFKWTTRTKQSRYNDRLIDSSWYQILVATLSHGINIYSKFCSRYEPRSSRRNISCVLKFSGSSQQLHPTTSRCKRNGGPILFNNPSSTVARAWWCVPWR